MAEKKKKKKKERDDGRAESHSAFSATQDERSASPMQEAKK